MRYHYLFTLIILITIITGSCTTSPDVLKNAESLMEAHPDSSLHVLQKIHKIYHLNTADRALYALLLSQALDRTDSLMVSDSIIDIATNYYSHEQPEYAGKAWFYKARCARNRGNANQQAEALLKAQQYACQTKEWKLIALIFCDKADMYQNQNKTDSALILNKKGLVYFRLAKDIRNVSLTANSIGTLYYNSHTNSDSALIYLTYALKTAKLTNDPVILSFTLKSIGLFEYHRNNYRKTIEYCNQAPITNLPVYDENTLNIKAFCYFRLSKIDSAKYYISKIKKPDVVGVNYYDLKQMIYEKEGDFKSALLYARKIDSLKDTLNQKQLHESFAGMERKFKFETISSEYQALVIKDKQKGIIILITLLAISIIIIIVLFWQSRVKKREYKIFQELNKKEKILLQQANENNELLQRQNKMQQVLLKSVEKYKVDSRKGKINVPDIKDNNFKEEIIIHIDSIYRNFSQRLQTRYPALTKNDILLCVLLLAGFETGMIATILDIKLSSVNIQRGRLRKRLELVNNENLIEFLHKF